MGSNAKKRNSNLLEVLSAKRQYSVNNYTAFFLAACGVILAVKIG